MEGRVAEQPIVQQCQVRRHWMGSSTALRAGSGHKYQILEKGRQSDCQMQERIIDESS